MISNNHNCEDMHIVDAQSVRSVTHQGCAMTILLEYAYAFGICKEMHQVLPVASLPTKGVVRFRSIQG